MGEARVKSVVVVAALILDERGRILIAQRPAGKKRAGEWEFPGGKAEPGETVAAALVREIDEELGARVEPGETFEVLPHVYPDLEVVVHFVWCRLAPGAAVERREHARLEWVEPARMVEFEFVEADRALLPRIAAAVGRR